MWLLFATTGMRRGEVVGLLWDAVDLDAGRITVAQTITLVGNRPHRKPLPKSEAGERSFALDADTVAALRAHRARQHAERLAYGPTWVDDGLVFTRTDGAALHPERVSDWFEQRCRRAGLPHIGIHGLRHSYATVALRAGVSPEVLAERLGHADVAITLSIYAHVRRQDDEEAAVVAAAAILGTGGPQ